MASSPPAGHRQLPHTADVALEAWAPTREACIDEMVRAFVEVFADVTGAPATGSLAFRVAARDDDDLLVAVLEEVLYAVEVHGVVPLAFHLDRPADDEAAGWFDTTDLERVTASGSVPKGVSRQDLSVERGDGWRAHVMVDV